MSALPGTVYLVRRRGADDDAWSVVDALEAVSYAECPAQWEVEELERIRPAELPGEGDRRGSAGRLRQELRRPGQPTTPNLAADAADKERAK